MSTAKPDSVLVPVDFSDASFRAIDTALELAGSADKVHVLYVSPFPQTEADYLREALMQHDLDQVSTELKAKLASLGHANVETQVTEGIPGDEIASAARNAKAELIVMPSHSRSGIPRFFLGSVTSEVLRQAPCPVLVLRRE